MLLLYGKMCPLGGVWGDQQFSIFILGPLHISVINGARKLKFGTLEGMYARYKNLSAMGHLGNHELPLFILGPPHISETDRGRKLKVGTLAGICSYYGYMLKFDR